MKSIETREGQAESHYFIAIGVYADALKLFQDGPNRVLPHLNPEFRLARNQIIDLLGQARENLNLAEDFGMPDVEKIKSLRAKINELFEKLKESKN